MTCGHEKHHDRLVPPLVCNLPVGHDGPHGIAILPGMRPYVRWVA